MPLVAFVLLRPNTYTGWRHFYFLHGPFCLLATFALMGLRQLSVRGVRKRWLGGAACALTAAGLGGAALEMAQIHPNQHLYFNFLADRKTPERLRTRYEMDYWNITLRQGYEYLLRQTPAATINIKKRYFFTERWWDIKILPAADRRRFTYDPSRNLDFLLSEGVPWLTLLPTNDSFPPVLHRIKVYNNTIMTVATPNLSRVDPAVADEYRALLRAATAGEPVARGSGYEVYLHDGRLAWVKEACEPGALMFLFQLAFYPVDASRVSPFRQSQGNNIKQVYGARVDGKCLGAARLPEYAVSRVRLRQRLEEGGAFWKVEVPF